MTFSSRRRSRAAAHAVGIAATVAVVGIVEILIRAGVINRNVEDARGAKDDGLEFAGAVIVQVEDQPDPVAHRRA